MNKQEKEIKERINEINIQDVVLQGKGINRLSEQVNPAYKGQILEKDIADYQELLDKIHRRLIESQHFLPEQDRTLLIAPASPEQPPEQPQQKPSPREPENSI